MMAFDGDHEQSHPDENPGLCCHALMPVIN